MYVLACIYIYIYISSHTDMYKMYVHEDMSMCVYVLMCVHFMWHVCVCDCDNLTVYVCVVCVSCVCVTCVLCVCVSK